MTYRTYGITGIWTDKLSYLNGYKNTPYGFLLPYGVSFYIFTINKAA